MSTVVQRFQRNTRGRDFVVGDIHGAYDLVVAALREARFTPHVDRLFAVGDLIDRGKGSHRCAKFLAQPYIHAVKGNHEQTLLDLYADGTPDERALELIAPRFGLQWWLKVDEDQRQEILAAIQTLPLAIEIDTPRGTVGLVHADIPDQMSWQEFTAALEANHEQTIETCLWGRARIQSASENGVPGIGRVFVGHTPQWDGLVRYGNVYAIDSGAVFGEQFHDRHGHERDGAGKGHLTMANIRMGTQELTARRRQVGLVDLREEMRPLTAPFGRYLTADLLAATTSPLHSV